MGIFGKRTRTPFLPPLGLNTSPQQLVRSAPFTFEESEAPAVSLQKLTTGGHVSLVKGFEAATKALHDVELPGIRFQVIVMVDGSGSMIPDYRDGLVQEMLLRVLGFSLNVDKDGEIPVIVYGHRVGKPVMVNLSNYREINTIIKPDFGSTSMTEAFIKAMEVASETAEITLIVNITDGDPNNKVSMSNEVIRSSGHPVILKNLAIRPVAYLEEIDDLPSQFEIRKKTDANGNKVLDANGDEIPEKDADRLIIDRNPEGLRLIDNVDSKALNPKTASPEEFASKIAAEISDILEVQARVGLATNVPGIPRLF